MPQNASLRHQGTEIRDLKGEVWVAGVGSVLLQYFESFSIQSLLPHLLGSKIVTTKSIKKVSSAKKQPRPKAVKSVNKPVLSKAALAAASRISKDPEKAKAFLQEAGIITKSGKLTARYS
jgi:hypothetical protein